MKKLLRFISLYCSGGVLIAWLLCIYKMATVPFFDVGFRTFMVAGSLCGIIGEIIPNPPNNVRTVTVLFRTVSWVLFVVAAIGIMEISSDFPSLMTNGFSFFVFVMCVVTVVCKIWAEWIAIRQECIEADNQLKNI